MRVSRRDFLPLSASFVCAGGPFARAAQQHAPHAKFPSKPRERLSVTSYPFRTLIDSPTNRDRDSNVPGIDLTRFPSLIAEKFGVYNINPLVAHFRSMDPAYLNTFRKAVADAHSHVVDLGLPGKRFYSSDATIRQAAVESGRTWIDIAAAVGSPSVRQHVSGDGEKPSIDLASDSLGRLAEYGSQRNVVINLENDNAIAEDPFFLLSLIEKVGNPYLRALPDLGNSLITHDDAYNEKALTTMFKYAFNMCHVKDEVVSPEGQRKSVNLARLFQLAKAGSYRGYFSMEFETKVGDVFAGTQRLIEESLRNLG